MKVRKTPSRRSTLRRRQSCFRAWRIANLAGYSELGEPIDINQAWVLARDLGTGLAALRFCARCNVHYLAGDASRTALRCPICALTTGRRAASRAPAPVSRNTRRCCARGRA